MKRVLPFLLVFIAMPAFALYYPIFDQRNVGVSVGQTITVEVRAGFSGLWILPFDWRFGSTAPGVAAVEGGLASGQGGKGTVRITGLAPGEAKVKLYSTEYVTISVYCENERPIQPANPSLTTERGKPIALNVISEIAPRTTFAWFAGRAGDKSHPLPVGGPSINFTPDAFGTHYVWVNAWTPCSVSAAEFRIDVPLPKRRAMR